MGDLEVRIVHLEPLRVASALGFGESPEDIAWTKILTWARGKGLLDDLEAVRFFGFNNPNPSKGSPNYGYEQWITVGPEIETEGEIEVKEFEGGLYAVVRCQGIPNISVTWEKLVAWLVASPYKRAHHQWLEECLNPAVEGDQPLEDLVFDLYAPIAQ